MIELEGIFQGRRARQGSSLLDPKQGGREGQLQADCSTESKGRGGTFNSGHTTDSVLSMSIKNSYCKCTDDFSETEHFRILIFPSNNALNRMMLFPLFSP